MKINQCVTCGFAMTVPDNSGRKYCDDCRIVRNRDKVREWYTAEVRECRLRSRKKQKEKYQNNVQYRLLIHARKRAQEKNLPFGLIYEDIIVPRECPILKTPFEFKTYQTASIDRIDNDKGYVKGNIQVISHKANAMKNSASPEELRAFAQWILKKEVSREPKVPEVVDGKVVVKNDVQVGLDNV